MASKIPTSMRGLALARHCNPSEYNIGTLPVPQISRQHELLIKVKAASVNPSDVKLASSMGKMMGNATFPYKLGYDCAGEVVSVGKSVSLFKPGDLIYSCACTSEDYRGSIAEYTLSTESTTALKPPSLSFVEAAAIPLAAMTALQALERGNQQTGGLKGKTVFIPAGLSGTGIFAVQIAKNIYGAGKVITTLSTGKIPLIKELMGETAPDQVVDYTKGDVVTAIGKGEVDFMFDTMQNTLSANSVMKKDGVIICVSTVPNGTEFKEKKGLQGSMPWYLEYGLNFMDWILRKWTSWKGVNYSYLLMEGRRDGLVKLSKWVEEGKLRPVVGSTVKMEDIEGLRRGCQQILEGKGGIGKFVIEIE